MKFLTVVAIASISFGVGSYTTQPTFPTFGKEMDWRRVGKNTHGTEIYVDTKNVSTGSGDNAVFTLMLLGKEEMTITNIRVDCVAESVRFGPAVIYKFNGKQLVHDMWDDKNTKEIADNSAAGIITNAFCEGGVQNTTPKINI